MKRKIVQVGPSTLMVSLPNKWCKEVGVKKGDEIELEVQAEALRIFPGSQHTFTQEIEIDVTHSDKYQVDRLLTVLYRNGFDKINIHHQKLSLYSAKIKRDVPTQQYLQKLSKRFIGMEITSQTEQRTEVVCFLLRDFEKAEVVEKRIFFLLKETMTNLLQSINNHFEQFDDVMYDNHDNIVKFLNYYHRILGKLPLEENIKRQRYALYIVLDKVVDKLRHLSSKIREYGCTPQVKNVVAETFTFFWEHFSEFYAGKVRKELFSKRYRLIQQIDRMKLTAAELRVVKELDLLLNVTNDFTETAFCEKFRDPQKMPVVV